MGPGVRRQSTDAFLAHRKEGTPVNMMDLSRHQDWITRNRGPIGDYPEIVQGKRGRPALVARSLIMQCVWRSWCSPAPRASGIVSKCHESTHLLPYPRRQRSVISMRFGVGVDALLDHRSRTLMRAVGQPVIKASRAAKLTLQREPCSLTDARWLALCVSIGYHLRAHWGEGVVWSPHLHVQGCAAQSPAF
jgi:hypothetical protein